VNGTLPILRVFLARSGKTIHSGLVHLGEDGAFCNRGGNSAARPAQRKSSSFLKMMVEEDPLYFSAKSPMNAARPSLLQFTKSLGQGDSFVKSASYLLHSSVLKSGFHTHNAA
jgi:hypothetical protein